jgi:hypothetical protein
MKLIVGVSLGVIAVLMLVQFSLRTEEPSQARGASSISAGGPARAALERSAPDSSAAPSIAATELAEGAAGSSKEVDLAEDLVEDNLVYTGETLILGEPSDPEENLEGVDTYTGPRLILGEPSDPNESDGSEGAFSNNPIQLGEYADPLAPSDPNEQSVSNPVELGEPSDPDIEFDFEADFKALNLGEASEPDDP